MRSESAVRRDAPHIRDATREQLRASSEHGVQENKRENSAVLEGRAHLQVVITRDWSPETARRLGGGKIRHPVQNNSSSNLPPQRRTFDAWRLPTYYLGFAAHLCAGVDVQEPHGRSRYDQSHRDLNRREDRDGEEGRHGLADDRLGHVDHEQGRQKYAVHDLNSKESKRGKRGRQRLVAVCLHGAVGCLLSEA